MYMVITSKKKKCIDIHIYDVQGPSYEKAQCVQMDNVFPQRQMYDEPLLLHEGKMQWLFDHRGKRYLDMFGGIATVSVGHCHPSVHQIIKYIIYM